MGLSQFHSYKPTLHGTILVSFEQKFLVWDRLCHSRKTSLHGTISVQFEPNLSNFNTWNRLAVSFEKTSLHGTIDVQDKQNLQSSLVSNGDNLFLG
jgi:hypothetical protein